MCHNYDYIVIPRFGSHRRSRESQSQQVSPKYDDMVPILTLAIIIVKCVLFKIKPEQGFVATCLK